MVGPLLAEHIGRQQWLPLESVSSQAGKLEPSAVERPLCAVAGWDIFSSSSSNTWKPENVSVSLASVAGGGDRHGLRDSALLFLENPFW